MKALRVTNGSSNWTIALENPGVLSATVMCIEIPNRREEEVILEMGGLDSKTKSHIRWHPINLQVGDQIVVEVIEDCPGDEPDEIKEEDPKFREETAKQYIRNNAKKFGWDIVEKES